MLATLVKAAPAGDGWLHEIKYDGYRTLADLFAQRQGMDRGVATDRSIGGRAATELGMARRRSRRRRRAGTHEFPAAAERAQRARHAQAHVLRLRPSVRRRLRPAC